MRGLEVRESKAFRSCRRAESGIAGRRRKATEDQGNSRPRNSTISEAYISKSDDTRAIHRIASDGAATIKSDVDLFPL